MKRNVWQIWSWWGLGWLLSYPIALQLSLTAAIAQPVKFKPPSPPPRGISGNRSAAASRDKCPEVTQPLTALVPKYQSNRIWGLTEAEHPTFWFYIPYAASEIVDISFTLQDESNPNDTQIVYQNPKIVAATSPGTIGIVLPKSIAPLAANKPYHWYLKLNMSCTVGKRPMFVDGWVQRAEIDDNLSARIKQASPAQQVDLYAENGLWYDALTTLANLRAAKPQDTSLLEDWQNLLNSIELGNLASAPVSDRQQPNLKKPNAQSFQPEKTGF